MLKVDEAEQFVREGLRANPSDPRLLFELGRIYRENREDPGRARNLWELGLSRFQQWEDSERESSIFLHAQLLGNLAKLEEDEGNFEASIHHLKRLKQVSPNSSNIQTWIDLLAERGRKPSSD